MAVLGLWFGPGGAAAADINAGCTAGVGSVAGLQAAIALANTSGGADTVLLGSGCTYTISAPYSNFWFGPNGLPPIASDITIEGNGATIVRDPAATKFRFFFVGGDPATVVSPGAGSLTLRQMTLSGGLAQGGAGHGGGAGAGFGGAIFNQGSLALDGVTLNANTATGGTPVDAVPSGGGGVGADAPVGGAGGGFDPTFVAPLGSGVGGAGNASGGGGGAGFAPGENGAAAAAGVAGAGGGSATGLGAMGAGAGGGPGGNGSGGGGQGSAAGGDGGNFGAGGQFVLGSSGAVGGGGGGVGGGGAEGKNSAGDGYGGAGGFGGGGGFGNGPGPGNTGAGGRGGFGGGGGGMGGAIFNLAGAVTVSSSTLAHNSAHGGGFAGPVGKGLGGGIFNLSGTVTVSDSTLAANSADDGGAQLYNLVYDSATVRTASATLTRSLLAGGGGGADVISDKPATVSGGAADLGTATVDATGSLIDVGVTLGTGTITGSPLDADPALGPLQDNGGPTQTLLPPPGSAALDAGPITGCPGVDQRGALRPAGSACDLGAVERAVPSAVTGTATPVAIHSATVSGIASNPGVVAGSAHFVYGTTMGYGSTTTPVALVHATTDAPVSAVLSGLAPATLYHYRLTATDSEGTTSGADRTFTTAPLPGAPSILIARPANGGRYGQGQVVSAAYACAGTSITSCTGPVASGGRVETGAVGVHTFTVSATDQNGQHTTKTVLYRVIAVPLLVCGGSEIALADVHPDGKHVLVSGVTEPSFAGQNVAIVLAGKTVGHAKVKSSGAFAATLALPPRKQRAGARYSASIAGQRSAALKLQRLAFFTRARLSHGKLLLAGGVTGRFKPGAQVRIQSIGLCTKKTTLATTKLTSKGTWKLTIKAPPHAEALLYRARIKLSKGFTFTLAVPATP